MKTALVVSLFAACLAAIFAQPIEERFRRGIADPDVKFRENEIDSSLNELVRTKKSPKEKTSEIFIGKGIEKDVSQTAEFPNIDDKKEEEIASQVKTSLEDLESNKDGESVKDDSDRSRRQQPLFLSPVALDGIAPNMVLRGSLQPQLTRTQPIIQTVVPASQTTHTVHQPGCVCSCPGCISRSSDQPELLPSSPYPLRASSELKTSQLYGLEQQTTDDRLKIMRASQQQDLLQQLKLQQQVNLLQQQMDQQRAVDQMQQLQLELQNQKLAEQRSAADSQDPECTLKKLATLQLPDDILKQLIMMEQQRVQKIKDCQGKTSEPKELQFLSEIVAKEVELLQKQVELLQRSNAEKKKLDEKKTR